MREEFGARGVVSASLELGDEDVRREEALAGRAEQERRVRIYAAWYAKHGTLGNLQQILTQEANGTFAVPDEGIPAEQVCARCTRRPRTPSRDGTDGLYCSECRGYLRGRCVRLGGARSTEDAADAPMPCEHCGKRKRSIRYGDGLCHVCRYSLAQQDRRAAAKECRTKASV